MPRPLKGVLLWQCSRTLLSTLSFVACMVCNPFVIAGELCLSTARLLSPPWT